MTLFPLSALFADGRDPAAVVALLDGAPVSLARLRADVAGNARHLKDAGCRRGLLATQDAYWGAVGLFALLHAGAEVVVPQNAQPGTLAALADAWDLVVCDRPPPGVAPVHVLAPGGEGTGLNPLDPAAPLAFFTSGSTGAPKRVAKTLALLEREAEAIERLLGPVVPAGARVHATVTHQHVYGLAFRLCWPLATGRPFAGTTHELWETALAVLERGDALVTSPAHLGRLAGIAPVPPGRRPSLVLSAGAPLDEAAARGAEAVFNVPPTEIFGSTETGAIAWRRRIAPDPPWRPLPGVAVESDADGALLVRAPHAPGGVHHGADRVAVLPDGGLRFLGRADRVVKIEGKRVSLPEVEEQLRRLPWVADAAAVVLDGAVPVLGAAVVPSAEGAAALSAQGAFRFGRALRRGLAATQEPAGLPRRWRFVDALPGGTLGKRRAADIAALFEDPSMPTSLSPSRPTEPEVRAVHPRDGGADLDLFLPADLAQVEGHFPQAPIVPGVAQIDWAVTLGARHLGLPLEVAQTFQVKFRRIIAPGQPVTLALRHVAARRRLTFEYRSGDEILSSGSIALEGT